jgi:ribonuclease HI
MLKNRAAPTTLHKVRAHTNIIGNEEIDKLAKEGSKIDPENNMPTPYHIGVEKTITHTKAQ